MNIPWFIDFDQPYWPANLRGLQAMETPSMASGGIGMPSQAPESMRPSMGSGMMGTQRPMGTAGWLTALALSDNEWEAQQDAAYFLSMCPMPIRVMQKYVEEICDEKEYANSLMYDDYPDQVMLSKLRGKILERAADDEVLFGKEGYFESLDSRDAKDIAEILLYREIAARRRRRRSMGR